MSVSVCLNPIFLQSRVLTGSIARKSHEALWLVRFSRWICPVWRICRTSRVKQPFEQVACTFRQEFFRSPARPPPRLNCVGCRDPADDPEGGMTRVHLCEYQATSPGMGSPGKYVYRCRFDGKRFKRLAGAITIFSLGIPERANSFAAPCA
jgi:hypothetical protein